MLGQSESALLSGDTTHGPAVGTYYYHPNHIQSTSVVTDATGNEVTRMAYLPFGEVSQANSTGANTVTAKFTGQDYDDSFGLYYYNARYYDPSIGRFMSADTVVPDAWNAQAYNRYSYALNNPINYVDPSGHMPWLAWVFSPILAPIIVVAAAVAIVATAALAAFGVMPNPLTASGRTEIANDLRNDYQDASQWFDDAGDKITGMMSGLFTSGRGGGGVSWTDWQDWNLHGAGNYAAGFADTLTSGFGLTHLAGLPSLTEAIRVLDGTAGLIDTGSGWYNGGVWSGRLWGVATGAGAVNSAAGAASAAEAAGAAGGAAAAVTSGSQVTEGMIREAMKDAPLVSQQAGGVSLPTIQRYVDRLLAGEVPPAIKVDGPFIVDGNHRYIAGRILGQEPPIQDWLGGRGPAVPWSEIKISIDW